MRRSRLGPRVSQRRTKGDGLLSAGGAYRAAVTSLGQGVEADAAGALVISALRRARRVGAAERASLASTDSGDEGAGHRPPRKRTRRLSPPARPADMHQPCTNGAPPPPPHHVNGDSATRNGDLQPPGLRMSQTDQEIVRLIGQHLLSIGLEWVQLSVHYSSFGLRCTSHTLQLCFVIENISVYIAFNSHTL